MSDVKLEEKEKLGAVRPIDGDSKHKDILLQTSSGVLVWTTVPNDQVDIIQDQLAKQQAAESKETSSSSYSP